MIHEYCLTRKASSRSRQRGLRHTFLLLLLLLLLLPSIVTSSSSYSLSPPTAVWLLLLLSFASTFAAVDDDDDFLVALPSLVDASASAFTRRVATMIISEIENNAIFALNYCIPAFPHKIKTLITLGTHTSLRSGFSVKRQ
jgi:uncharacterized membrane protein